MSSKVCVCVCLSEGVAWKLKCHKTKIICLIHFNSNLVLLSPSLWNIIITAAAAANEVTRRPAIASELKWRQDKQVCDSN